MGNEISSGKQESGLLNKGTLPPAPTVEPPKPSACLPEKDHFAELHQKLLQVALHTGNENPLSLRQISEIISPFLPPTTEFASGSEIISQFPSANELRITAVEVGEITISPPTPRVIHFGHYEKKLFHVKLALDGTKFNLELTPIPNTNSFYYKPNFFEFDVILEIKEDKRTLSKSQNEVLADLVVTKPAPPQEGTTTSSSEIPEEEVVQVLPMRGDTFVTEIRYSETIPASYFLQYLSSRLCSVDFSNVHHILEIPQVPITVTAFLFALRSTRNSGWVLYSVKQIKLDEQIMVLMDGAKYPVNEMRCVVSSCVLNAIVVEPEVQLLSLQLHQLYGRPTTVNLTISKPMDRLLYIRRREPILPIIPQDLKVVPPKSLGTITFSNQGQLPIISMDMPRFFKQYCFVQLITGFTVESGNTLVMRSGHLHTHINCNKIEFLNVYFRRLSGVTSDLSLALKLAPLQGQESEEIRFFQAENLTEHALSQESLSGIKKKVDNINLGQVLLDQCNFFIWKNSNHNVTAKKLNELRKYTITSVSSNVSFTKCVFEIIMEISKNSQPAVTSGDNTATMTMLLDLEKMVATITEKRLLGIELEFGLRSADALPRLQALLFDAATKSSQFLDISLCFDSKSTTIRTPSEVENS